MLDKRKLCVFAMVALITGCASHRPAPSTEPHPSRYRLYCTPAWEDIGAALHMRYAESDHRELLLSARLKSVHANQQSPVYRYTIETGALEQIDPGQWGDSTEKVAVSRNHDIGTETRFVSEDPFDYGLLFNKIPVPNQPKPVLILRRVGNDRCVVMAATTYLQTGMFIPGPIITEGPYYHHLYSYSTGAPLGEREILPFPDSSGAISVCISSDARFAVYHDNEMTMLCIVDLHRH